MSSKASPSAVHEEGNSFHTTPQPSAFDKHVHRRCVFSKECVCLRGPIYETGVNLSFEIMLDWVSTEYNYTQCRSSSLS